VPRRHSRPRSVQDEFGPQPVGSYSNATRIQNFSGRLAATLADRRRADLAIAYVRLLAFPFALVEAAVESYPAGDDRWAWAATGTLAAGATVLVVLSHRGGIRGLGLAALAFDTLWLSGWVALYGYEPGSPVRQLLLLPLLEAAIRYGLPRGLLFPPATIPALALFEWRQSERVGVAFDPGHVLFPVGLQLLVGLVVGALIEHARNLRPGRQERSD
jgi:hypothetical protein